MGLSAILAVFATSDEQAMSRVQNQDDHRAFAQLIERWEKPIRNLCIRMTGDLHRGEDLKQETFARLYEKRRDYKPTGKFSSYLWRMALNICYDDLRRTKRQSTDLLREEADQDADSPLPVDHDNPREQAVQSEEGRMVRDAIQALPEIYRVVVILRHYENLKMREIAEVLQLPPGTVHSRLAEALGQLARSLQPHLAPKALCAPLPACLPRPPETSIL